VFAFKTITPEGDAIYAFNQFRLCLQRRPGGTVNAQLQLMSKTRDKVVASVKLNYIADTHAGCQKLWSNDAIIQVPAKARAAPQFAADISVGGEQVISLWADYTPTTRFMLVQAKACL
jgi:hypothetical protein